MNFQQLRSLREAARRGFNLTEVARVLNTSQPGVSRQIRELEDELGVDLFVRAGKRLTALTEMGELVLPTVENMLRDADNLRRAGEEFSQQLQGPVVDRGHALAGALRAARRGARLPRALSRRPLQPAPGLARPGRRHADHRRGRRRHRHRGAERIRRARHPAVLPLDAQRHRAEGPPAAGLGAADARRPGRLSDHHLQPGYTGRLHIDDAFEKAGLAFDLIITAMDADVIKTYVELGLGVGIVASIAFDEARDTNLHAIDAGHLFAVNLTKLAIRRGRFLRAYVYEFIETFAAPLDRAAVEAALATSPGVPAST